MIVVPASRWHVAIVLAESNVFGITGGRTHKPSKMMNAQVCCVQGATWKLFFHRGVESIVAIEPWHAQQCVLHTFS
jgi:hypothetical protein